LKGHPSNFFLKAANLNLPLVYSSTWQAEPKSTYPLSLSLSLSLSVQKEKEKETKILAPHKHLPKKKKK